MGLNIMQRNHDNWAKLARAFVPDKLI
jgi:hypothetical protein